MFKNVADIFMIKDDILTLLDASLLSRCPALVDLMTCLAATLSLNCWIRITNLCSLPVLSINQQKKKSMSAKIKDLLFPEIFIRHKLRHAFVHLSTSKNLQRVLKLKRIIYEK
jgi:hypothetical protein